jgi:hypothetical protein
MTVIERIASKLDKLRDLDKSLEIFGAIKHKYRFHSRLTEKEAAAFERRHSIELPTEYRAFLLELGNGGVGPFYGVFRLGTMDRQDEDEPWPKGFIGKLSDPFPHKKKWNPVDAYADDEDDDDFSRDDEAFDPAMMAGSFPICHHGCALRSWLVVSGPRRGQVWYDGRADGDGVWPQTDSDGKPLSFGAWYETWIDESLAELGKSLRRRR